MSTESPQREAFRYHEVEQHVLRLIDSKQYPPGSRLPSLRAVARHLTASLSTVCHAYEELERRGVVESRPRSGYYVRTLPSPLPLPHSAPAEEEEPREANRSRLIATVLEAVGNPQMAPFGVVSPDPTLLPGKKLGQIMADLTRRNAEQCVAYETIPGNTEYRMQIARRACEDGMPTRASEVVATTGAMEALYIALRVLTRPGDNVLIQSPTYHCFLQLLETLGLRAVEIPSDPKHGINPADLSKALSTFEVSACILSGNFNNPDGSITPDAAKREIVEILAAKNIPLVDDDVSADLHFDGKRPASFKQYDKKGIVVFCSSYSKTIAPGYRAGWMLPGRFMEKALEVKATTNVCCTSPTQAAIAEFLRLDLYDKQLKKLRSALQGQIHHMHECIVASFPEGTRVTSPRGGGVLWLELPPAINGVDLFFKARASRIGIAPGSIFSTRDRFSNYIRLSCCGIWNQRMEEALRELGGLAKELA
ncbi:PLP-dependent aminotransferase family protein [Oleidesulfovibrio sp.]|uniref:aminotransferase-like domain-containing protein n=1 Tax=Oleidesulfovibrio sp. TaxID=2909707 RepID=UPI003A85204D